MRFCIFVYGDAPEEKEQPEQEKHDEQGDRKDTSGSPGETAQGDGDLFFYDSGGFTAPSCRKKRYHPQ